MNAKLTLQHSVFAILLIALPLQTQAALFVIDNFNQDQDAWSFNGDSINSGPLQLNTPGSTHLSNAERTLFSQSGAGSNTFQAVQAVGGLLQITNSVTSDGIASVLWDGFDSVDFISLGINAFLLDILAIDHDVDIDFVVNGISSSPLQNFAGPGNNYVNFNDFSVPSVFNEVTSIRLNLRGPAAWDGQVKLVGAQNPSTVPEPDLFILLSFALIVFGLVKKNRTEL
ncbi:hypothetical protein [Methylotuvimicrobium sp.]|jgi:hypothetical protein|uniref:hypothetical protein n=1 Tax=Methylotuvimicrobium sp. TaxID=2822413 RepID=UPI003D65478A